MPTDPEPTFRSPALKTSASLDDVDFLYIIGLCKFYSALRTEANLLSQKENRYPVWDLHKKTTNSAQAEEWEMKHSISKYALVGIFLFSPMAILADVIFDESVGGDIGSSPPLETFAFDEGINEIIGTLTFTDTEFDFDYFDFILSEGRTLTSVTYSFFAVEAASNTTSLQAGFQISVSGNPSSSCFLDSPANVITDSSPVVYDSCLFTGGTITGFDFGAGTWTWSHGLSKGGGEGSGGTWSYSLAFDVAGGDSVSVPEPGTLALLGAGLIGMGFVRRRKKAE